MPIPIQYRNNQIAKEAYARGISDGTEPLYKMILSHIDNLLEVANELGTLRDENKKLRLFLSHMNIPAEAAVR